MQSFKKTLIIGYVFSLVLLAASSAASLVCIENLLNSQYWVDHTHVVIDKLRSAVSALKDAEAGQRGFLLTGKAQFLSGHADSYETVNHLLDDTKTLTADNPEQQTTIDELRDTINRRIQLLESMVEDKKKGINPSPSDVLMGESYTTQASRLVDLMVSREQTLLNARTEKLNRFADATPAFIIIASLLGLFVTILSFYRVGKDFDRRVKLQAELEYKENQTTNRLQIIQGIAEQIAAGDYSSRVKDESKDILGNLSVHLNKMAESLDNSFRDLADKQWLQSGIAQLNERMIGEKNLDKLAYNVIDYIASYTQSPVGAFYLKRDDDALALAAGFAISKNKMRQTIAMGEGVPGQCALSGKEVSLSHVEQTDMLISYAAGEIKPRHIFTVPVFFEESLRAVIEIAALKPFSETIKEFLRTAAYNVGMAIRSASDHQKLQELLEETQSQSEELQAQHNELENANAELEAQSEKLQSSDEELRVQQEELQEANKELEERSRQLENQNNLIFERNLEIQRKADELAQSTRYKSEFLANMSHELRTPLNSILLLSRLLGENPGHSLTAEQMEYAKVIENSGKGLLVLINDILDLSKIESGKMDLEFNKVAIQQMVDDLRGLFEVIAHEKKISLEFFIRQGTPPAIETDHLRLAQILRNLVSNAIKFTKEGFVRMEIYPQGENICFAVQDSGIGIAPENQQTIFEAFRQADGSTIRQYGGTGLGLSISRELARIMSGEIKLASEENKGSLFVLTIPAQKHQETKQEIPPNSGSSFPPLVTEAKERFDPRQASAISAGQVPDDRKDIQPGDKVILIVEDDLNFARALLNFTRLENYKAVIATRGDEGIELAKRYQPKGILLDIELPVKNGWEVMNELKAAVSTRAIPIHVISAHEVKIKSLSTGAADFIDKSEAFEKLPEVFRRIEEVLSRHPKKVLIVEENSRHARALAFFLENYDVNAEIRDSVEDSISALQDNQVNCVILDTDLSAGLSYETLEKVKKTPGLENLPIILFTGKSISRPEEMRIRQYADSIVIKTANSYERILDEVSLFLHLVSENNKNTSGLAYRRKGELGEVLKGKTVLVVDDDVRNIFSISRALEKYGVNIVTAIDGKDALKQLDQNKPVDIVLMDMMMPEMDGYECARQIRKMPAFKNLPIIALTAKAMSGDREKCIEAGASDYITKPVDIDQLISLLRVWLYE